jgi:cell division septum initiation protein DivIVA
VKAVQADEAESVGHDRPGADVIALPQLERLPAETEEVSAGFVGLDSRSSRLEALELVRAAVELADRIERDAQDTAKDRLARIEEEVRLRRTSLDDREAALEHARRELDNLRQEYERKRQELDESRIELETYRRQMVEAGQALQLHAEQEKTELLAQASAQAQALLEQARSDAAQLTEAARSEAAAIGEAARSQAAQLTSAAHAEAEHVVQAAAVEADQLVREAQVTEVPSTEVEAPPEREPAPVEAEATVTEPESAPEPEPTSAPPDGSGPREDDQRAFTPPPVSVEDLATVSSLPRLGILNRLRDH